QNDMVVLGELRCDLVPACVVLRIAVNEKQWWPRAAVTQPDHRPARAHVEMLEARKMCRHLRGAPTRGVAGIVCLRRRRHDAQSGVLHVSWHWVSPCAAGRLRTLC